MSVDASRILCIDNDRVLESRCAVLERCGYDASAASVRMAELLLRRQKYDLVILAAAINNEEKCRIIADAGNSQILALKGLTMPTELLSIVAERLARVRPRSG